MADLDDFFAKKDKKKTKKPKFLTAEELVKNLEETSKREAALKNVKRTELNNGNAALSMGAGVGSNFSVPETGATINAGLNNFPSASTVSESINSLASTSLSTVTSINTATAADHNKLTSKYIEEVNPDEEWNEYEVEQRKDYSGLKIGQLTLNEDNLSNYQSNTQELDAVGNVIINPDGQSAWKIVKDEKTAAASTAAPTEPVKPVGIYRPPIQNFQSKMRLKTAPDLKNEDFFPTLDAARPEEQRKKKAEPAFEEVRPGQGARWQPRSMRDHHSSSSSSSAYQQHHYSNNYSNNSNSGGGFNRNSSSTSESMRSNTNRFRSLEETNS